MNTLKGITAFVTGGAGVLGSSVVRHIIKRGGKAAVFDLPESSANLLLEKINSPNAIFTPGNIKSEKDIKESIERAHKELGQINTCVSCAGVNNAFQIVNPTTAVPNKLEDIVKVIETNLIGTFNTTRLMAEYMSKLDPDENFSRGVIINTSGFYDKDGWKGQTTISAAAAAISGMTLPLARDLASSGIRICTISPGIFESTFTENWPDDVNIFLKNLTLHPQRYGKPREFATLVETIIKNSMLNGTVIKLDAGFRLSVL